MHLIKDDFGTVPVARATKLARMDKIMAVAMCGRPPMTKQPVLRALDGDGTDEAQQDVPGDSRHGLSGVLLQTR